MISVMSRSLRGQIVAKWPNVSLQDGLPNGNLEVDQANASIINHILVYFGQTFFFCVSLKN